MRITIETKLTESQVAACRNLSDVLRSDQYKQAQGHLRCEESNSFCCLGVACDISRLGTWAGSGYVVGEKCFGGFPPEQVKLIYGFGYNQSSDSVETNLNVLNDGGTPFYKIADEIDRQVQENINKFATAESSYGS